MSFSDDEERDFTDVFRHDYHWHYAFPLSGRGWPRIENPTVEEEDIAKAFCPKLYVNSDLFAQERGILAWTLKVKDIPTRGWFKLLKFLHFRNEKETADSIFHFCSGKNRHPYRKEVDLGAYLWLLSRVDDFLEEIIFERTALERKLGAYIETDERLQFLKYLENQLSDLKLKKESAENSEIQEIDDKLFREIFPDEKSRTCTIKYSVLRPPLDIDNAQDRKRIKQKIAGTPIEEIFDVLLDVFEDSDLICIQYFIYWPIQVWPYHRFDYEPIYVFLHRRRNLEEETVQSSSEESQLLSKQFEILLVVFNAVPSLWSSIKSVFLYLTLRKRPGHLIRSFINWDFPFEPGNLFNFLDPSYYNEVSKFMKKAYGGKYVYEMLPEENRDESHTDALLDEEGRIVLYVENNWHAFSDKKHIKKEKGWIKLDDFEPQPMVDHDLLHIEWNVTNPFRAPFLYPVVGEKEPRMHLPLKVQHFCDSSFGIYGIWDQMCEEEWDYSQFQTSSNSNMAEVYRLGWLMKFLCERKGIDKTKTNELLMKIYRHYRPESKENLISAEE